MANPSDVSQIQHERLTFLELRAYFTGELRRGNIEARFDIKAAAALRFYDRERERFSDLVLTRIAKTQEIDGDMAEHELLSADEQWARMADMEIVPQPGIKWPKAEADYAMEGGALRVKTRAALAGHVLRRWGIDSTDDHRLAPASHHLWLRNRQTLYGVESASLAPGRPDDVQKGRQ